MKRLMVLTLLLSTLGSLVLIVRSLTVISSQKISSGPALAGGMSEALVPVTTGVFVCVVLYAAACWFEWMLLRRRASWNYFYARVKIPPPATT